MLGAETTDCDSPIALINATFQWIEENVKDSIDFVVWTGDSARHDNDEQIPRSEKQVEDLNEFLVDKFVEVFGKEDNINDTDPTNDFIVPIVPTFGNNDVLPHNIFSPGPNRWTKRYLDIWNRFIPEEQRHGFSSGGWFLVEVIPNKLAVFSLNTLYFFNSNAAVDGCAARSEPGYEHMEWLRIQLEFLRRRGMKAIISGHVPPARTESKSSWDETCWQKYTLCMKQYRDVIVGSLYGHMNIDHFMLQDFHEIDTKLMKEKAEAVRRTTLDDELDIKSSANYLTELRMEWSRLPDAALVNEENGLKRREKSTTEKFYDKIGGHWGERYSVTLVSPSLVPNYFPTLRVVEYNVTGIEAIATDSLSDESNLKHNHLVANAEDQLGEKHTEYEEKKKKYGKPKKSKYITPDPPSKSAPPGPAYSPQTFTWLSYTQYFANLTRINNDFSDEAVSEHDDAHDVGWHKGKHSDKRPAKKDPKKRLRKFIFEIEYNTRTDKIFALKDLTVRSFINLAARIGRYQLGEVFGELDMGGDEDEDISEVSSSKKKNKKKKKHKKDKKHKHHNSRKSINKTWFTFVSRAFVSTRDEDDLRDDF